jgi:DNA-binding NtrC family response regulator
MGNENTGNMLEERIRICFFTGDPAFAHMIVRALGQGFDLQTIEESTVAGAERQVTRCGAVLLDMRSLGTEPEADQAAFQLINDIRQLDSSPPIVAMVGADSHDLARQLLHRGAYNTIASPPDIIELRLLLRHAYGAHRAERELSLLRSQEPADPFSDLTAYSEPMRHAISLARRVAPCDVSTLITGETGTGKELMARAVHRMSSRATGPFVAFSCANLPESLVEDELFGHERGAFTGATAVRRGRFEVAHQGTLFLDEIGDLALGLQSKLLRVLQQRSFERLGSNTPLNVNIRLVCATHRNLEEMVDQGKFRSDLYYRLNVVQIHIPPLRERTDEIVCLSQQFLACFAKRFNKDVVRFSPLCLRVLEEYSWPGNVRQLENVVQHAVVMAEGPSVEVWHLPKAFHNGTEGRTPTRTYDEEIREFKRRLILRTLDECGGNKSEAARRLGIVRGYLHRLISQLEIEIESSDSAEETVDEPQGLVAAM